MTGTCYWRCTACPDSGEGDRGAEAHVKATKHSVLTSAHKSIEGVLADRYWLTDKGWAAVGGRST